MAGQSSLHELTETQLRGQLSKLAGPSGYKVRLKIEEELERRGLDKSIPSENALAEAEIESQEEPSSENQSLFVENYDPNIIFQYAKQLLRSADSIVLSWTIYGLLGGGAAAAVVSVAVGLDDLLMVCSGIAAVAGGIWGNSQGSRRAFLLKLEAQKVLCQVQIEMNTRRRQK